MGEHDELRLADYGYALRRWWLTIVVVALAFAVIAGLIARSSHGDQATRVDIDIIPEANLRGVPDPVRPDSEQLAALMRGRLDRYTGDIDSSITVDAVADLIRVSGSGTDSDTATNDAMTVAQRFVDERRVERREQHAEVREFHLSRIDPLQDQINELTTRVQDLAEFGGDTLAVQTQLVQSLATMISHQEQAAEAEFLSETSNADVADPVVVERESGGIGTKVGAAAGLIVGIVAGIAVVVVRTHLDRRVRTARQVERLVPDAGIIEVVRAGAGPADVAPLVHALARTVDGSTVRRVELVGVDKAGSNVASSLAAALRDARRSAIPGRDDALEIEVDTGSSLTDDGDDAQRAVLLVARSGKSDSYDLSRRATDLRLAGVPVVGVVLAGVPSLELAWAFDRDGAAYELSR